MTRDPTDKSETGSGKAKIRMAPKRLADRSGRFSTWIRSIWRQRWLSLTIAWVICVAGWTATALWPSHYMSSAVVYADLHRLIPETTKGEGEASAEPSNQGPVDLLKTVLLNDQNLADVREAVKLDEKDAATLATDILIRATAPTLFVASYDHSDPAVAHTVLEKLFSNFSDRLSRTKSEETAELEKEIADLEQQLDMADANLSKFEEANAELFDEAASETADVAILEEELADLQQRIERAIIERDEVAQELAQLPASQQALNNSGNDPGNDLADDPAPAATLTESQKNELLLLEERLAGLRERYADSHPYVSTVLDEIDVIKSGAGAGGPPTPVDDDGNSLQIDSSETNEQLIDLQQLHQEKLAKVSELNNESANKQREIDRLSALTDTTTSAEAERSRLTAEKNDLEAALADLVSRRDQAQQPSGGQQDQQKASAEQSSFRLINGPNLPEKPTGLSRLMCLALVLVGGLAIGGIAAVVRNRSKGVFESAWQLKQRFDVGVLGTISEVLSPAERKRLGRSRLVFGLGCFVLMAVFSGLAIAEFLNLLTPLGDRLRTQLLG